MTARNRPLVVSICRRLEGIPLAIEMAARWLGLLPRPEIVARLDDRFAILAKLGLTSRVQLASWAATDASTVRS